MKIKQYFDSFKGLIIYLFLTFGISLILKLLPPIKNMFLLNIVNLITPLSICLVLIIIYKNCFKNKFKDFQINKNKYLNLIFKYWLVGVLLMIMTNIIISSITKNIATNEELNRTLLNSLPLYSIISSIFLAPINEELIFRASFKEISSNIMVKSLISAFLFGFLHVVFNGDFIYIIPYASLGFFLAKAYFETDNIYVSIIMHAWHNFLCILILTLGGLL